jgi:transposase
LARYGRRTQRLETIVHHLGLALGGENGTARNAIGDFQSMIRSKTAHRLDDWLETAKNSLVGSFANGVEKDIDAVRNAIISPWSNGQTEGQITRLKLIKRQMYGRAKLDLLQARLIGAS